jgi:Na+/H+-dicarboxylate symporter
VREDGTAQGPSAGTRPSGRPSLWARYRGLSLGVKIFIYMIFGVILGFVAPSWAMALGPLGDLFIRLLLMAAIPLVFFNLLAGLTALDSLGILGRLGGKVMAYYLATTTVALTVGIAIMSWLRPGDGFELSGGAGAVDEDFGEVPGVAQIILDLFPENVIRAFAEGNVAQIVVFAIFLGVATLLLPEKQQEPLARVYNAFADALRKLVDIIMHFGPIGIGALIAATVGEYGDELFGPMALFLGGIWLGQLFMFLLQMGILATLSDMRPREFLGRTGPLYATAAGTCSSLATLSTALQMAEERLRIPRSVYSFTLPLGAQLNKDGTALMLTAVLLFTAQAAGVSFTFGEMIIILLVGLILSEGSGGIPGGGAVIAMIFVQAFQLPLEIAGIVIGVYRLIDMGNTTINVTGDMVASIVIAQSEGWSREEVRAVIEGNGPEAGPAGEVDGAPPSSHRPEREPREEMTPR